MRRGWKKEATIDPGGTSREELIWVARKRQTVWREGDEGGNNNAPQGWTFCWGWSGEGEEKTRNFIPRHYLPETSKQSSRKLVRKPIFYQCYVLKSRSVFLDSCLSYGKLLLFAFLVPLTCNEILSICYASHVICCILGSQEQRTA